MDKKTLEELNKSSKRSNEIHARESRIVRNCLLILKVINDGNEVNRADLAQICGDVSRRTIDRYLTVLRDVGYDIYYNRRHGCYEIQNKDDIDLSYIY